MSKLKAVRGIILLLVLGVGLVAGIYFGVRKVQDIRSKAAPMVCGDMRWPADPNSACGRSTQQPAQGATNVSLTPNFAWDYGGYRSGETGCVSSMGCASYAVSVYLTENGASRPFARADLPPAGAATAAIKNAAFSDFHLCNYGNPSDPNTCHTDGQPVISPLKPNTAYQWKPTPFFDSIVHAEQTWVYTFTTGTAAPSSGGCQNITMTPNSRTVTFASETRSLTATGVNITNFVWSATGGTLSATSGQTVTWTAPASLPAVSQAWTIAVRAVSQGLPGSGDIQSQNEMIMPGGGQLLQAMWRGNAGYSRTVPISGATIQWPAAGAGWTKNVDLNTNPASFPGTGDLQVQDEFIMPNGQLLQAFWRGNVGYSRTVPVSGSTISWPATDAGWTQAARASDFPGSGDIQAQDSLIMPGGTQLLQIVWRGGVAYQRMVNITGQTINWPSTNNAGWSQVALASDFPGTGDIQSQNDFILPDGTQLLQLVWKGNKAYQRIVNISGTTILWPASNATGWTVVADLTGEGSTGNPCQMTLTYTPSSPVAPLPACQRVTADKDLGSIKINDTVTFTGYGTITNPASDDAIDKIQFIIMKGGSVVSDPTVDTALDNTFANVKTWKATSSYKITGAGSYSVQIKVHSLKDNSWRQ